ncbi:MAG: hypothetical protein JW990_06490 [Thermoleophilia bacterium]|nr:hypothetical protein [Thermoleophilia bacterium]
MNGHGPHAQMFRQAAKGLRFGTPRSYEGLCVLPLLSATECHAKYVLLGEALARGALTITEIDETGSVPYLTAANEGPWPVLIFDGEELVGAKQNRISNATVLVGVGKSVLPVSCVEQGRWSRRSAAFSAGAYAAHPSLRMEKESLVRRHAAAVAGGVRSGRLESQEERASRFGGAQAEVWEEVSRTSVCLGVESETAALADTFKSRGRDVDDYVRALDFSENERAAETVGAMVFFEGRFVCADLLRPAKHFGRLYPKLLRGYALEALVSTNKREFFARGGIEQLAPSDTQERSDFDPESAALRLFAELGDAEIEAQSAVDLGEDIRLRSRSLSGSGLAWNEEFLQVSLFPREAA